MAESQDNCQINFSCLKCLKMSRIRRAVQVLVWGFFVFLLFKARFPYSGKIPSDLFLRFDPLAQIIGSITQRSVLQWLWMGLITLMFTALLGRVFCGWICPMGATIDFFDLTIWRKRSFSQRQKLFWLKYFLLVVIIFSALLGVNFGFLLDPIPLITRIYTLVFYPLGAVVGKLLLDIFQPVFSKLNLSYFYYLEITLPSYNQIFLTASIFFVIIGLGYFQPRFFCVNLCPLGALLGIFSRFSLLAKRISERCINCGICQRACPTGAIEKDNWQDREAECIKCFICQSRCPADAIKYRISYFEADRMNKIDLSRRRFILAGALGIGAGMVARAYPVNKSGAKDIIRPPGALPEADFLALCTRCGECMKICPTKVIQPEGIEQGLMGFATPKMVMRMAGCDQECNLCGMVCPTGALRHLEVEEKRYAKLGTAEINKERCLVWAWNKPCLICDEICPYNAIVFHTIEGMRRPIVIPSRCNGCGWCEYACPVEGESAIRVSKSGEIRLKEGSYKQEAIKRGIDLESSDLLEEKGE